MSHLRTSSLHTAGGLPSTALPPVTMHSVRPSLQWPCLEFAEKSPHLPGRGDRPQGLMAARTPRKPCEDSQTCTSPTAPHAAATSGSKSKGRKTWASWGRMSLQRKKGNSFNNCFSSVYCVPGTVPDTTAYKTGKVPASWSLHSTALYRWSELAQAKQLLRN